MTQSKEQIFIQLVKHKLKYRLFLLLKLPLAFFCRLKVASLDSQKAIVTVPFNWFNKNPFGSTYFAVLTMAAELSTGILAFAKLYKQEVKVSMLVTQVQAHFLKKATAITTFICNDGDKIQATINEAILTKQPQQITCKSIGYNKHNEEVAHFEFTWSFKAKS